MPRNPDAAVAALAVCRQYDVPVLSRGGGTSLAGQCCNAGVVIDWSKYCTRVTSVDTDAGIAVVEPGIKLDQLNDELDSSGWMVGHRHAYPWTFHTGEKGGRDRRPPRHAELR